ncbi:hypothetical protein C4K27_3202 [Pseudomonas chlororaphis subsp. chlororaphis]|nr:hypothetical protein C4K27_3202 [Pseudomonas chlororaphis subsp. chlororaphis]
MDPACGFEWAGHLSNAWANSSGIGWRPRQIWRPAFLNK